jgi:hypothetical protein
MQNDRNTGMKNDIQIIDKINYGMYESALEKNMILEAYIS